MDFSTAFCVVVCFVSVETLLQLQKVSVWSVIADIFMFCLVVKIISTLFVGKAVSVCLPRKLKKRFAQTNAGNFFVMLTFSTAFGVVVCFVSVETAFQLQKVSVSSVIADIFMFCLAVKIISTLFVGKTVRVCLPRKFKKSLSKQTQVIFC